MNVTWKIMNIEWISEFGGLSKVVSGAHYWVEAEDEEGNKGYTFSRVAFDLDDLTDFVAFEELTEELVVSWVQTHLLKVTNYVRDDITGMSIVDEIQHRAIIMCLEQDPLRKRGIGVPW